MAMPEDVTVKGGAEAGSGVQAALHRTFGMHGGGVQLMMMMMMMMMMIMVNCFIYEEISVMYLAF